MNEILGEICFCMGVKWTIFLDHGLRGRGGGLASVSGFCSKEELPGCTVARSIRQPAYESFSCMHTTGPHVPPSTQHMDC